MVAGEGGKDLQFSESVCVGGGMLKNKLKVKVYIVRRLVLLSNFFTAFIWKVISFQIISVHITPIVLNSHSGLSIKLMHLIKI